MRCKHWPSGELGSAVGGGEVSKLHTYTLSSQPSRSRPPSSSTPSPHVRTLPASEVERESTGGDWIRGTRLPVRGHPRVGVTPTAGRVCALVLREEAPAADGGILSVLGEPGTQNWGQNQRGYRERSQEAASRGRISDLAEVPALCLRRERGLS